MAQPTMNTRRLATFAAVLAVAALFALGCKAKLSASVSTKTGLDVKTDIGKPEPPPPPPAPPAPAPSPGIDELLSQTLSGDHRSEESKRRDPSRHPAETLKFMGLEPGMTVMELCPEQGWFTEVLAPVLAPSGKLVVTNWNQDSALPPELLESAKFFQKKLEGNQAVYGMVVTVPIDMTYQLGAPETVDMVLTFRNSHLWTRAKQEDMVYKAVFDVLKPGGIFGLEAHRAKKGDKAAQSSAKGYLPEDYVIAKVKAAGFELVEKSEINANPKDTKDYKRGVWSLPPVLAYGKKDRAKYEAIGESDRMTLKFRKPAAAQGVPAVTPEQPATTAQEPPAPSDVVAPSAAPDNGITEIKE